MVAAQYAFHDMDANFCTSLHDNLTYPLPHRTLQNLVSIFCDPHDVKFMVEPNVRS